MANSLQNFKRSRAQWGMEIARSALIKQGFDILRREWRLKDFAEIDYLVMHSDTSRFYLVEVKTHARYLGDSHSIIAKAQINRLQRAANFLKRLWHCPEIRIILIWVNPLNDSVEFFENPC